MTLEEEFRQSFYRRLAPLRDNHSAVLVQNIDTKKLYVRKELELYDEQVFRFLKENPIPNMPRVIDVAEDGGRLIVIEEHIAGDTLQEIMDQRGTFTEKETVNYILQLCDIIKALHSAPAPIIHRDIKPSNIVLSPDGVIKLLDMDAAKIASDTKSQDTVLMGTAGYAAPEQYGFAASNVQTDIYAIGILMNVMLTGQLPQEKLYAGRLSGVISICTKIDWHSRYGSIEHLIRAINRAMGRIEPAVVEKEPSKQAPVVAPAKPPIQFTVSATDDCYHFPEADLKYKYLLPGMRSGNPVKAILSGVGYVVLFLLVKDITVQNVTPAEVVANKVIMFSIFMSIILFSANYLNVKSRFKLTSSRKRWVRVLGTIAFDLVIFYAWFTVLLIIEMVL